MSKTRRSLSGVVGKRSSLMHMASSNANAHELATIPEPSMVSTSAHSILPIYANQGHSQPDHRAPSPPASSYFPSVSSLQTGEPQPTPGASTHFAYSTTLRRHQNEGSLGLHLHLPPKVSDIAPSVTAAGLWQKAVSAVTGQRGQDDALEGGYSLVGGRSSPPPVHREEKKDTPSARFAHWNVEVSGVTLPVLVVSCPAGK